MRLAEKVAESSTMKQRHGAVIVKSGRVMSVGINKWRNHPEIIETEKIKQECSVHAEVDALSRVKNPRGATIYIARVNRLGESGLSRPCNNCFKDLVKSGINKIIYT